MPRLDFRHMANGIKLPIEAYRAVVEERPLDLCIHCEFHWECETAPKLPHEEYRDTHRCVICGQSLTDFDN